MTRDFVGQIKLTNDRGDYDLLMKTPKPKQKEVTILKMDWHEGVGWKSCNNKKEVTMWAIWSPYSKEINLNTAAKTRKEAWEHCSDCTAELVVDLKKEGYRAVKGKFVWEEK